MNSIQDSLNSYKTKYPKEGDLVDTFVSVLTSYQKPFSRESRKGHFTGSAFVISSDFTKLLMTHHKKLGIWIQLGGHCDGNEDVYSVALREAKEESGLETLTPFFDTPEIFDIDRHLIPQYKDVEEHFHYDIRYLFIADHHEKLVVSDESMDLQWIPCKHVSEYNEETSILRPLEKISQITKIEVF